MESLIIIVIFILGLLFGSFLCCMGYRIPNKISVVRPGSFCPHCKKSLKWYMNIPLISFIFLKGRCAYCREKISFVYPLCEILTALLYLSAYLYFGFSIEFYIAIVISSALVVTIVSDFIYFYVSDRVILTSILALIAILYIFNGLNVTFYRLLSGIAMFLIMSAIKFVGDRVFKKESMGGGDLKLMGVIGMAVGFIQSFFVLFIASVSGLLFAIITMKKRSNGIIPFGPFLLLGALLVLYLKDTIDLFINYFFV